MKKFLNTLLLICCFVSVLSYFASNWIDKNWDKHFSYHTNYWGQNNVTDEELEVQPDVNYTFVVNYYANKDNSGIEMLELKVNYFTDYQMQDVYSLGVQIVNPSVMNVSLEKNGHTKDPFAKKYIYYYKYFMDYGSIKPIYFNTDDGVSFISTTTFNDRSVPFIIKIDDKPYAFDFEKKILEYDWTFLFQSYYNEYSSDFEYFLYKLYDSTSHISDGEGIYTNLKMEFTDVFNIYEYNSSSGKFDILSSYGYDVNYISFKVNYFERGVKKHEDSLFNQIGKETAGGVIWGN